ncbi:MAG: hypothetical protein P8L45_07365 [Longimicrobiales bacterium]|nr:hypothetical protein [Longimicrobiales bacterium]
MAQHTERRLQEVVVARYSWRHEAEFAAGFLDDAGIPYRLQIDDPSMGISVSTAATLWVLGRDEAAARDILDINDQHTPRLSTPRSPNHPAPRRASRPSSADPGAAIAAEYAPVGLEPGGRASGLPFRARSLSILAGIGIAGLERAVFPYGSTPALEVSAAALAAVLILVGIVGWAPRVMRDLLRAVSGSAP